MNRIKANGVKRILATNNSVELKTDFKYFTSMSNIVILSEEDIMNDNKLLTLRGSIIDCLFIPKKFKYTLKEQKSYDELQGSITNDTVISYY